MILWADTFTNYFHAEIGIAAVEALEDAGFHVVIPELHLCCGRPLYDYGMLDLARRYAQKVVRELRAEIRAGTPVVGIEPSCVAVFKDELKKLMTFDEDAERLSKQTFHFAEFLEKIEYEPPQLAGKALLHGHCHHKATGGISHEQKLLEQMGLDVEELELGLLRDGRRLGLRAGPLRRLDGLRRARPAAEGARRGSRDPGRQRRLLLPHADRAGRHRAARRSTSRRC